MGVLLGIAGASFGVALSLGSGWFPPEHKGLAMGIAGAGNSGTVLAVHPVASGTHVGYRQRTCPRDGTLDVSIRVSPFEPIQPLSVLIDGIEGLSSLPVRSGHLAEIHVALPAAATLARVSQAFELVTSLK